MVAVRFDRIAMKVDRIAIQVVRKRSGSAGGIRGRHRPEIDANVAVFERPERYNKAYSGRCRSRWHA